MEDVRQCPNCGERSLFRKACGSPEWNCDWCLESYTDEEMDAYDREPVWEYDDNEEEDWDD